MAGLACAEPAASVSRQGSGNPQKAEKSPEARLQDGLSCLKNADIPCAQIALAGIPGQSSYAKLLSGNIAAAEGDFDKTFRMLLPLQANNAFSPAAFASLHASLSLAYENQPNPLLALEQRTLAERYLPKDAEIQANQQRIWSLLSALPLDQLIEMRGESLDTTVQGWIDLAIAAKSAEPAGQKLAAWQTVYPDHPAKAFSVGLGDSLASMNANDDKSRSPASLKGNIALLLPFASEAYYPAADAIERGFEAAQAGAGGNATIKIYPTTGSPEEISTIYAQAIAEGASYVVGPLTRDEATALAATRTEVPTLVLNHPEQAQASRNLYTLGLSAENEAAQIAKLARNSGMHSAAIIGTMSATSLRMAKAFSEAWTADGGQISLQTRLTGNTDLASLKPQITEHADMVLIAGSAEDARNIRPYLDISIPTFGFSRIYSGVRHDPQDAVLNGIRFIDLPWMLNTEDPAYAAYRTSTADLPQGEMQRWFAVGVDAYQILLAISQGNAATLQGLTGKIRVAPGGGISRELAVGRFSENDVVLEKLP